MYDVCCMYGYITTVYLLLLLCRVQYWECLYCKVYDIYKRTNRYVVTTVEYKLLLLLPCKNDTTTTTNAYDVALI